MGTIDVRSRGFATNWQVSGTGAAMQGLIRALGWALSAYLRAQSRRQLAGLDDRALRDIGLSRADVAHESAKPFWR